MERSINKELHKAAHPVFTTTERVLLLETKGIGPKVVERLEMAGYGSFARLRKADASGIAGEIAIMLGATCWKNSPQARASLQAAIDLAHADAQRRR